MLSLAEATWAQSGADASLVIPLHPRVSTLLQLPDVVEDVWINHRGEIRVARSGSQIYLRPRPGTRAGVEGLLEVETATMRLTFQLRVVRRARDAREELVILALAPEQDAKEAVPDAEPAPDAGPQPDAGSSPDVAHLSDAGSMLGTEQARPTETKSAAGASVSASNPTAELAPVPTEPAAERDIAMDAAADRESDDEAIRAPRFELSVHAVISLAGVTTLELAGYEPESGRQPHRAFALRLVGARPDAWWALQARVGVEWPVAPLTYDRTESGMERLDRLHVSGPWVHAELGGVAWLGRTWMPTIHADIGVLAHLRRTDMPDNSPDSDVAETTRHGVVLTLGMGLHRRVGGLVLGVDFQTRYGWLDEYHSMAVLGIVGWVLDQGD